MKEVVILSDHPSHYVPACTWVRTHAFVFIGKCITRLQWQIYKLYLCCYGFHLFVNLLAQNNSYKHYFIKLSENINNWHKEHTIRFWL